MKTRRTVLEGLLSVASGAGMSAVLRAGDPPARLEVGEASIEVSFDSDPFDLGQAALLNWVMQSARAATTYYGRFPVTHARVRLLQSSGARVSNGESLLLAAEMLGFSSTYISVASPYFSVM